MKEIPVYGIGCYVYFSHEMETLLNEYRKECEWETEEYDGRPLRDEDYIFRRKGEALPMTPSTFTWRFKQTRVEPLPVLQGRFSPIHR